MEQIAKKPREAFLGQSGDAFRQRLRFFGHGTVHGLGLGPFERLGLGYHEAVEQQLDKGLAPNLIVAIAAQRCKVTNVNVTS